MKKILYLLLLIPSLVFGQAPYKTNAIQVDTVRSLKNNGKVILKDTTIFKDGQKQISAFTETLKSNLGTSYNLSHAHLNKPVLDGIKASDTTRWASGGTAYAGSKTIIVRNDSILADTIQLFSPKSSQIVSNKIAFKMPNSTLGRINVNSNLSYSPDTTGAKSGYVTTGEFKGNGTNTLTLTGFSNIGTTLFDNTDSIVNVIAFAKIEEVYVYNILTTYKIPNTTTALNKVTNLTATSVTYAKDSLHWTDTNTSPNETYLRVRRATLANMSNATTLTSTLAPNTVSYVDNTVSSGVKYYYGVTAIGDGSTTSNSPEDTVSCQTQTQSSPIPEDALLFRYKFKGNVADSSGNSNHLTNYQSTLTTDRFGTTNRAYNMNNQQYIYNTSNMTNPQSAGQAYTLSFWVKHNNAQPASAQLWYMGTGSIAIKFYNNQFIYVDATHSFSSYDASSFLSNTSTWQHLLITFSGTSATLYINGASVGTISVNTAAVSGGFAFSAYASNTGYQGQISDVRIYSRVLNSTEIAAIYNATSL